MQSVWSASRRLFSLRSLCGKTIAFFFFTVKLFKRIKKSVKSSSNVIKTSAFFGACSLSVNLCSTNSEDRISIQGGRIDPEHSRKLTYGSRQPQVWVVEWRRQETPECCEACPHLLGNPFNRRYTLCRLQKVSPHTTNSSSRFFVLFFEYCWPQVWWVRQDIQWKGGKVILHKNALESSLLQVSRPCQGQLYVRLNIKTPGHNLGQSLSN